jgi:protein SCO1
MPARTNRPVVTFRVAVLVGAVLIAIAVVGARLPWPFPQPNAATVPPELANVLLPSPHPLKAFTLRDDQGRWFDLDRLRGNWTLMFFGYTSCPDICPTTLVTLRDLAGKLDTEDDVQYVFVTVDPARDDLRTVGNYLDFFHSEFIGVSGEPGQIQAFMKQLNVMAVRNNAEDSDSYTIAHTSSIMLIDPEARFLGAFSPPHSAPRIAQQFQILLDHLEDQER